MIYYVVFALDFHPAKRCEGSILFNISAKKKKQANIKPGQAPCFSGPVNPLLRGQIPLKDTARGVPGLGGSGRT